MTSLIIEKLSFKTDLDALSRLIQALSGLARELSKLLFALALLLTCSPVAEGYSSRMQDRPASASTVQAKALRPQNAASSKRPGVSHARKTAANAG